MNHESDTAATRRAAMVIADLDGTLLHDGATFEQRALSQRTIDAVGRLRERGIPFAIATARPVSTGLDMVRALKADACVYLNGALIDFMPARTDFAMLTGAAPAPRGSVVKIGFPADTACALCRRIVRTVPDVEIGIVMDDVRYTNFDVSRYWKTQTWRPTDFTDVPRGIADKIIVFPQPGQERALRALIPDDFDVHVSEGRMWMLMAKQANKRHATQTLCERWGIDPRNVVAFGDDVIDIGMMQVAGTGVAVANANPQVLAVAREICPSNNEDGVAQWIEQHLF